MSESADISSFVFSRLRKCALFFCALTTLALFLAGCDTSPDGLVREGDRQLRQGDRNKALALYREALKQAPDHVEARDKAARLETTIQRERQQQFEDAFVAFFIITSFPLSLLLIFKHTAPGRELLYRIQLFTGLHNWQEAEDVRADFSATRDFLVRRGVKSYLSPLSNILREFFLMRDAYVYSQTRLQELDRILHEDLPRLREISQEAADSGFARETIGNAAAYARRIEQQKLSIEEFQMIFIEKKRQLVGFLIDLRTRLDLDDSFDGRHEIELLVQQIAAIRSTFLAAEKTWE